VISLIVNKKPASLAIQCEAVRLSDKTLMTDGSSFSSSLQRVCAGESVQLKTVSGQFPCTWLTYAVMNAKLRGRVLRVLRGGRHVLVV